MGRRARVALALLAGVIVLVALATAMAPRLINLAPLREQVAQHLAQRLRGTVDLGRIRLSLFGMPHVVIEHVRIAIPGRLAGTIASVAAYPQLASLLRGSVQFAEIEVESPNITLEPPPANESLGASDTGATDLPSQIAGALAAVSSSLAAQAQGLRLQVHNGGVTLNFTGVPPHSLTDLEASIQFAPERTLVELAAASSACERITAEFNMHPASQTGTGNIDLVRLHPQAFSTLLAASTGFELGNSEINLTLALRLNGPRAVEVEASGALPAVVLRRNDRTLSLAAPKFAARFTQHDDTTAITFNAVVQNPSAQLSGSMTFAASGPKTGIVLRGEGIDVAAAHDVALFFGGSLPIIRTILDVIRGGTVAEITYQAEGSSPANWSDRDALTVRGRLVGGAVHVPGANLDLHGVDGDVTIDDGILIGDRITARIEQSELQDGSLRLAFSGDAPALHVEALVRANAVDVLQLLSARTGGLGDAMNGVSDIHGGATGTVVVDGTIRDFATRVDLERSQVSARVAGIKPVVQLQAGSIRYANHTLTASDLSLAGGGMTVTATGLTWGRDSAGVQGLSLRDAHSDASFELHRAVNQLDVAFRGTLAQATLDALVTENHLLSGSVTGDIRIRAVLDQPANSTADGSLRIAHLLLPAPNGHHRVETLTINAQGRKLAVDASVGMQSGHRVRLAGRVQPAADALGADLDITADGLVWEEIALLLPGGNDSAMQQPNTPRWPLRGTVRVAADSFTVAGFTWAPVQAVVTAGANGFDVTVHRAVLCGIATPGTLAGEPASVTLAFKPSATQQQLADTLKCLGDTSRSITGVYDLSCELAASGPAAELRNHIGGRLTLRARNGRVYRSGAIEKLLSVVNAATGSITSLGNLRRDGIPYDSFVLSGTMEASRLRLRDLVFDGPTAKIVAEGWVDLGAQTLDVALLIAPLRAVDSALGRVPLVGDVLGGGLVTIPAKLSGPIADPSMTPIDPAGVGRGLMNTMTRTIKRPFKLIQPLWPGGGK
jgi:hypothetical protein